MANRTAVRAIRPLSKAEAHAQFQAHPELARNVSAAARQWGCSRATARERIAEWTAANDDDNFAATVAAVASPVARPVAPPATEQSGLITLAAYTAAIGLAAAAAYFSIRGMVVLFPSAPTAIVAMATVMEASKLISVAWLARQWRSTSWPLRAVLIVLVAGLAAINAAGVYSQLVAAHLGDRITATAAAESEAAALGARVDVQAATVADLDARVAQIDAAVSEMVRRGRAANALDAIGAQRKVREALSAQRRHEAEVLSGLKSERAAGAARASALEVEVTPIRYVAALFGGTADQAIRLLILLMVLTCDPLAIALTAAAASRRSEWSPRQSRRQHSAA
jgi:hypothetical protein